LHTGPRYGGGCLTQEQVKKAEEAGDETYVVDHGAFMDYIYGSDLEKMYGAEAPSIGLFMSCRSSGFSKGFFRKGGVIFVGSSGGASTKGMWYGAVDFLGALFSGNTLGAAKSAIRTTYTPYAVRTGATQSRMVVLINASNKGQGVLDKLTMFEIFGGQTTRMGGE
jgi:hypothetical protein